MINETTDPLGEFTRNPEYMDLRASQQAEDEIALDRGYDANDPDQVHRRRNEVARRERERLDFIHKIMVMQSGRKWIYGFMEDCSIYGNPFVQGDMYATAFKLGEQNTGKKLLADVQRFKELYCLMLQENK